jgi:hypothetical protein
MTIAHFSFGSECAAGWNARNQLIPFCSCSGDTTRLAVTPVKKALANSEPSTHGTEQTGSPIRNGLLAMSELAIVSSRELVSGEWLI